MSVAPTDPNRTQVDVYFDPTCPWTFRASLWLREVRRYRPIDLTWKFLSLYEVNRTSGNVRDTHVQSYATFPILALVRERYGNDGVDRLYRELGRARHERGEFFGEAGVVERALGDAGFDPALKAEAAARPDLEQAVLAEHRDAIERLGATAIPTLSIAGSRAILGPILTDVPRDQDAAEFWDHFSWLVRRDEFFEVKKSRG